MSESCTISWEIPLYILEDLFQSEFELREEIKIVDCEYDLDADALYVKFTADSRDSARMPESSIFGHRID